MLDSNWFHYNQAGMLLEIIVIIIITIIINILFEIGKNLRSSAKNLV